MAMIPADRTTHAHGAGASERAGDGRRREPGWVNAHTHIYSGLAPFGMPPPRQPPSTFVEILERVWWRLDRALDERALRASARYYIADALLRGTVALVDHHESPSFVEGSLDVLADACDELGMRAVLCFGATERNRGRAEAAQGLAECRRFAARNTRPLICGLVGLHASFTVSDETLREAGELCRELDTVMHVHVAEDMADVEDARRHGQAGPLERLLALRALPPGSILAHGVHLDAAQIRNAADHGLWLVQNPRSNEGNGVGYPRALRASSRVALGTDGYPSDMRDEAAALGRLARAHPSQEPGGEAVARARLEAGRQLVAERFGPRDARGGVVKDLARVAGGSTNATTGASADDHVELEPGPDGTPARVRRVVIGGRVAVDAGRLTAADFDEIVAHAREEADRLWARMESM